MIRRTLLTGFIALGVGGMTGCKSGSNGQGEKAPIKVAAAADLATAFKEVGDAFEKETGRPVKFTFGSTGLLSKQILEGAPFDVFAAANVSYVDEVVSGGYCDKSTQAMYARGRLAVWTKKGSDGPKTLADLKDTKFAKIAIANPEHAPYGKAAKEALQKEGVWDVVQSRIVFGENVQQTLQFAQTGNAEVAIVALSLAILSDGDYFLIDEAKHTPLEQSLVVCNEGGHTDAGKEFTHFVNSEKGRAIMKKYGFLLPGETASNGG